MEVQILRNMRIDKRLTEDEAATAVGVSREQYLALENGENAHGLSRALEKLVRVPPNWGQPAQPGEQAAGILTRNPNSEK